MKILARVITLISGLLAAFIALGIVLKVLGANRDNAIVSTVISGAQTLVGPFDDIFTVAGRTLEVAINWSLAAVVYLVVGAIIAALLRR